MGTAKIKTIHEAPPFIVNIWTLGEDEISHKYTVLIMAPSNIQPEILLGAAGSQLDLTHEKPITWEIISRYIAFRLDMRSKTEVDIREFPPVVWKVQP